MTQAANINELLSVAPMIDWTYSAFRVLMRILAPEAVLYTEMYTADAVIHNPQRSLYFQEIEKPLVMQLGGSCPKKLQDAALIAEDAGFSEINLNLGCPSDRVQAGRFGACLMADKYLVAKCISSMKSQVKIPVTAKTRIGIDNSDSYEFFSDFAATLLEAGCDKLIVHARKAWLKGLSPKQNRTIPKINYDYVYRLKQRFQDTPIIINGDIKTTVDIEHHLTKVDGVMLGRLAYQNPYQFGIIHNELYPEHKLLSRQEVASLYLSTVNTDNINFSLLLKPLFNLYHGVSGSKQWKEKLMQVQALKCTKSLKEIVV